MLTVFDVLNWIMTTQNADIIFSQMILDPAELGCVCTYQAAFICFPFLSVFFVNLFFFLYDSSSLFHLPLYFT